MLSLKACVSDGIRVDSNDLNGLSAVQTFHQLKTSSVMK